MRQWWAHLRFVWAILRGQPAMYRVHLDGCTLHFGSGPTTNTQGIRVFESSITNFLRASPTGRRDRTSTSSC